MTLFFNSLSPLTEKFVLTAFLLKGQKIILRIGLLIIEMFKNDVLEADAFDQIYNIIQTFPAKVIDVPMLCKALHKKKAGKVTNKILAEVRQQVRPEIIDSLQQNLTNNQKFIGNTLNFRLKFLN